MRRGRVTNIQSCRQAFAAIGGVDSGSLLPAPDEVFKDVYRLADISGDTATIEPTKRDMPGIREVADESFREEGIAVSERGGCVLEIIKMIVLEVSVSVPAQPRVQTGSSVNCAERLLRGRLVKSSNQQVSTNAGALFPRRRRDAANGDARISH